MGCHFVHDHFFIKKQIVMPHILAGGPDGPLVAFLVHMSKQYGENATIGSELMCALVDVTLSKSNLFVMTRNAVLLTNMCIGKCIDGIAKLVTKTDFSGLKARKYEESLKICENFLEGAWNKATQSQIDKSKSYKIFALAAMRAILHLFKKEKHGREGKEYTWNEIETMFNDDLAKGSICSMSTSDSSSSTPATQPDEKAISIHEGKDSMFLAKKELGLQPGTLYTLKDFGTRVWHLQHVTPTDVTLVFTPLLEPSKKMTVKYQAHEVLSKMRAYKGKPAKLFEDAEVTNLFPSTDSDEFLTCQIFQALLEAYNSEDLDVQDIYVQKFPRVAVYAKKNIKIKGVKLIPVPEKVSNLVLQEPKVPKYGMCKFQGTTMYITPPKPLKFPKPEDTNQEVSGMFATYWACIAKDGDGVLEEKMHTFKSSQGDIEIGILTNTQAIDAHQGVHIYEAPKNDKPCEPVPKKARK